MREEARRTGASVASQGLRKMPGRSLALAETWALVLLGRAPRSCSVVRETEAGDKRPRDSARAEECQAELLAVDPAHGSPVLALRDGAASASARAVPLSSLTALRLPLTGQERATLLSRLDGPFL